MASLRNSLITDGFTSTNVSLVTEGWADDQAAVSAIEILDFIPYVIEEEPVFNYATSAMVPSFQKEIRGGRTAPLIAGENYENIFKTDPGCDEILQRERVVSSFNFSSKQNIKGAPNFMDRLVNKTSFDSKEKIRGVLREATSNLDYFDLYKNPNPQKEHKPKRTGRDGGYNYEDEMFKK